MVIDLTSTATQVTFGAVVGVSQQAVSELLSRGVLVKGATLGAWLLAYCEHVRAVAAGRDPDGDLARERARVSRATAEKLEMANAVTRKEYAPTQALSLVLAGAARRCSNIMDGIPAQLRLRMPELDAAGLDIVRAELARARSEMASLSLDDIEKALAGDDGQGDADR